MDNEKIANLRLRIAGVKKKLSTEQDTDQRKKYQIEIKICELKIMVLEME